MFACLYQFVDLTWARKDPQDYWKRVMNGKPMPETIKDFYYQDSSSQFYSLSLKNSKTHILDQIQKNFDAAPQFLHCDTPFKIASQMFEHDNNGFEKDFVTSPHLFKTHKNSFHKYFKTAPQEFKTHNNDHFSKDFETAPQEFKTHNNDQFRNFFEISPQEFKTHNNDHFQDGFKTSSQEFKTHNNDHM